MDEISTGTLVAGAGFLAGIAFGATAQRTNFCTMGAISDAVFMGDFRRLRAWMLAIAVAMIGTQLLHGQGLLDIYKAVYLTANFGWLGAIVGGLMFGFGMTMAGGCGNKTLVRFGAGNLKSLVVFLVLGLFGYMTMRGLIGAGRIQVEAVVNMDLKARGLGSQGVVDIIAAGTGLSVGVMRWIVTAVFAGGLLLYCFKDADFRASPRNIAAGLIIGALIPAGWAITGILGNDEFEPVPLASFTFVAPTGETIQYLMTFTGSTINFGIAAVFGVILGAFLASVASREFHIEAFTDGADMARHLVGAALMGTGGVTALGCTIGQGITGMSTLALGSIIAWLSIMAGGVWGVKYLEEGSLGGALKAIFSRG